MQKKIFIRRFCVILLPIAGLIASFFYYSTYLNKGGVDAAMKNYYADVKKYANEYNLPTSYLMALIMLESSGKKHIKPRFEPSVFDKLKKLRAGKITKFEDLRPEDLKGLSNMQLRSLSRSYGPFQIMGYKAIKMGIKVSDFEGDDAIKYGIIWINKEYGNVLREGRFMDAFHQHNTGHRYPRSGKPETHNPDYVQNGLAFMRYFSNIQ
jgi:hypothetical protein